jgi:HSP20 family molecular chaperone IbpA
MFPRNVFGLFDEIDRLMWDTHSGYVRQRADEDRFEWDFDMPGLDAEDIETRLENQVLSIEGKNHDKNRIYAYRVILPRVADPDTLQARLENGVLTIRAERAESAKPRQIQIEAGERKELVADTS